MDKLGWLVDDRRFGPIRRDRTISVLICQILKTELFPEYLESQCLAEPKTNPRPQFNLIYMIIHDQNWAFVKFL